MSDARRTATVACGAGILAAAIGCTSSPAKNPSLHAIEPAAGFRGEDTPVEILGAGLDAGLQFDLDDDAVRVNLGFAARLDEHSLAGVTWLSTMTLHAVVPAGLPAGRYGLEVALPGGGTVALDPAFVVSDVPLGTVGALCDADLLCRAPAVCGPMGLCELPSDGPPPGDASGGDPLSGDPRAGDASPGDLATGDGSPCAACGPRLLDLTTFDRDHDGRVDLLGVRFSAPVSDASFDPAGAGVDDPSMTFNIDVAALADPSPAATDTPDDETVYLRIVEGAAYDTGELGTPNIGDGLFTALATADPTAGTVASATFSIDGAPPVLLETAVLDDGDGQLGPGDELVATFSEALAMIGPSTTDLTLAVTGDGFGTGASLSAAGDTVTVQLGPGVSLRPRFDFQPGVIAAGSPSGLGLAQPGAGPFRDAAGGAAVVRNRLGAIDIAGGFVPLPAGPVQDAAAMAFADLDVDARLDLVIAGSAGTAVFLGGGAMAFDSDPAAANAVAVAELTGDARPDVVVGGVLSLRALHNDGAGGFGAQTDLDPMQDVHDIATGDIDRDGLTDIVAATGAGVMLYRATGPGTFAAPSTFGAGPIGRLVLLDADRDGDLDLFTAPDGLGANTLYANSAGAFALDSTVDGPGLGVALAAGDLDRDGDTDIVEAASGHLLVYTSLAADTGVHAFPPPTVALAATGLTGVALADVDLDGDLDAVTSGADRLFTNPGDGLFMRGARGLGDGTPTTTVAAFDIDHDGDVDPVLGSAAAALVSRNDMRSTIAVPMSAGLVSDFFSEYFRDPGAPDASDLDVGDPNGDGVPDIVIAAGRADALYLGAPGGFALPAVSVSLMDSAVDRVRFADINRDGIEDLLFSGAAGVQLLLATDRMPTYGPAVFVYSAPPAPLGLEAADLDRDGWVDVVVGTGFGQSIQILYGNPMAANNLDAAVGIWPTNTETRRLAVVDFDLDGRLDLFLANVDSSDTSPYESNGWSCAAVGDYLVLATGPRTFATETRYDPYCKLTLGLMPYDVNFDGRPDVGAARGAWAEQTSWPRGMPLPVAGSNLGSAGGWRLMPEPLWARTIVVADFLIDGIGADGLEEVVIGVGDGAANAGLRFDPGNSDAERPITPMSATGEDFAFGTLSATFATAADMDRDGDLDVVVVGGTGPHHAGSAPGLVVFQNDLR